MGLGDGLRALAMQHLASGGSADELHQELANITPPGIGSMMDPGGRASPSLMAYAAEHPATEVAAPQAAVPETKAADPYANMINDPLRPGAFAGIAAGSPMAPLAATTPLASVAEQHPPMAPALTSGGQLAQLAMASGSGHTGYSGPVDAQNPYYPAMNAALGRSNAAEQASVAATERYGQALGAEGLGRAEELRIKGLQAQAEQPIRDEAVLNAEQHANRTQALQAQFQQKIDVQMGKYQAAADEAANTQVHNFFEDKSTGASIMAIVSQALAGAANGLSGNPGAPTPLDRIIAADMDRQKTNIELKGRNADRQGNMLRTLREELGSQQLAENAYYSAALDKTETMLKQLAPHYAGGINSAQAQQAMAVLAQKKEALAVQTQQHIAATETQKADAFGHAAEGFDSRQMAMSIAASKAEGKGKERSFVRGFKGTIPEHVATEAAKTQQNYYGVQSALADYEDVLKMPNSADKYLRIKGAANALQQALHVAGMIRPSQLHEFAENLAPSVSAAATNYLDARGQIHETRLALADLYQQQMLQYNPASAENPEGLRLDLSDPVMGPLWNESASRRNREAQLAAEAK